MLCSNEVKNRGVERAQARTHLTFFTFFPAIYSTYNGSARKKSSRIFSYARVRIRSNEFSPNNICLYIIAAGVARLRIGVAARIDYGHILPRVDINSAQIGTDGSTWL